MSTQSIPSLLFTPTRAGPGDARGHVDYPVLEDVA